MPSHVEKPDGAQLFDPHKFPARTISRAEPKEGLNRVVITLVRNDSFGPSPS
jgi:hypothetical protein